MKEEKLIVIAEDDHLNYQVLLAYLKKFGVTVHWTKDGWETFVYCIKKNVHLVLMDIKMPIMDGLQATYLIKKHKPQTIIIAQTAHTMSEDAEVCLAAGCDDYIPKPIDYHFFIEKMRYYLSIESNCYK